MINMCPFMIKKYIFKIKDVKKKNKAPVLVFKTN